MKWNDDDPNSLRYRTGVFKAMSWISIMAPLVGVGLEKPSLELEIHWSLLFGLTAIFFNTYILIKIHRTGLSNKLMKQSVFVNQTVFACGLITSGLLHSPHLPYIVVFIITAGFLLGRRGALISVLYSLVILALLGTMEFLKSPDLLIADAPYIAAIIGTIFSQGLIAYKSEKDLDTMHRKLKSESAIAIQASKLASLGEMAAGMAHEINNPLAIIDGAMKSLHRHGQDPEMLKRREAMIQDSVNRITKIVRGLKTFSRSTEQKHFEQVTVGQVFEETMNLVSHRLHQNAVDIHAAIPDQIYIRCDMIELTQVFVTIINNALDAMSGQDIKTLWVSCRSKTDGVKIRIEDSGPGIAHEHVEKLFQPFFTTKGVGEGTGLGLAIAKGIIESHGGRIDVCLASRGGCFEITYPAVVSEAA